MNYEEEQNSEIEAIQSIYPVELQIESLEYPASFSIEIKCEDFDESDPDCVECCLKFKYTKNYPDTPPELSIESASENLLDDDGGKIDAILTKLKTVAESNLGMVMCFLIVSSLQVCIFYGC